jgi:Ca2+-binding EF-hand superfamily protein
MGDAGGDGAATAYRYLDGPRETAAWATRGGLVAVSFGNGDRYEGHLSDARQREGKGTYTYAQAVDEEGAAVPGGRASSFRGSWQAGKKHGFGVFAYGNGDEYEGLWSNGQRSGQGTYRYAKGDVFSGEWVADKKHGAGAMVFAKPSSQLVGTWCNGTLLRGKWVHPDLSTYHGSFLGGAPAGAGVFYLRNGLTQRGVYQGAGGESKEEGEEEGSSGAARVFVGGKISRAYGAVSDLIVSGGAASHLAMGGGNQADDAVDFVVSTRRQPRKAAAGSVSGPGSPAAPAPAEAGPVAARAAEDDAIRQLFSALDANEDGALTLSELLDAISGGGGGGTSGALASVAPQLGDKAFHAFFDELDQDGNGKLSENEFREYFYLLKLFSFCDTNQSGKVSAGELCASLRRFPEAFPTALAEASGSRIKVSAFISEGDMDLDRQLSFPEFCHACFQLEREARAY